MLLTLLMTGCAAHFDPAPRPVGIGTVEVTIEGFDSDQGRALVNLFLDEDGFPSDWRRAYRAEELQIADHSVKFTFEGVPAGHFAVSVFHDVDGDYELNTNFLGMPTEKWGVSRDAGGFLGPPSFESAYLVLAPGEHLVITIPIG